jgi:type I restriction enzyme S subunit
MCTIFGRIGFRGYTKDDLVDFTGAITHSPSNIVDGVMNYEKCTYISWEKYDESPEIQVHNHDILLVKTGSSFGKCAYVESLPKEATINPQFVVLKNIGCNHKFLTYCLQSNYARTKYEEFVLGTAIPTFTQVALGAMLIPMPPLNEQERIVADIEKLLILVDLLDESKQDVEIMISTLRSKILGLAISGKLVPQNPNDEPAIDALRRINSSFQPCDNPQYEQLPKSWAVAKIGDVYTINPRNSADDKTEAGFVPMTNIHDGYNNSFSFELRNWGAIKTGFTHFRNGDIVVAKISPCLENRKSAVISGLPNGIGAGTTELHVFRQENINPLYGLMFFKTNNFIQSCTSSFNGAVGQQRVSTKVITDLEIPIPPIAEQQRIVDKVNELFTILDGIQNSLDAN